MRPRPISTNSGRYTHVSLLPLPPRERGEEKIAQASAKLNALSRYLHEASPVYLVHTDTHLGRCCTRAQAHLTGKGVQVAEPVEVEGLSSAESFQSGLANLVRQTARILAHHRKARICATGGFKPETALVTVLSFIAQAPRLLHTRGLPRHRPPPSPPHRLEIRGTTPPRSPRRHPTGRGNRRGQRRVQREIRPRNPAFRADVDMCHIDPIY